MNQYMDLAIKLAQKAYKYGDVPVGCAIVKNKKIIGKGYNRKNIKGISVYHAEMLAIIDACKKNKSWYLDDCDLYVTLKPCAMCMAAIAESRIKNVYYLTESNYENNINANLNKIKLEKVLYNSEYERMLSTFFDNIR